MATWPEPQFDPPLPPVSSSYVGAWFAQSEAALELNHIWIQEFKYAVLLDVLPLAPQLHLGVLSPGPRPYDALQQCLLDFYGAAYHPLPEVDSTVRESSPPTPSWPAPSASAPAPVCNRPRATSSPLSPPTMTRGSRDIADPTPDPVPHAVGSGDNDVTPAIRPPTNPSPNSSTRPAERASVSARQPYPVPTLLPLTLSTVDRPRHLQASESDAAAATFVPALHCPSSPSADLPLGPSGDRSDKSDDEGCEQLSRDADPADGLTPKSRDSSLDGVSQPRPDPVIRVVPTVALTKQHDPAAAAPALPDLRQPAPVLSLSVA